MKVYEETVSAVATNSAGSGSIDGIGIGPRGESGVKTKLLRQIIKRKTEVVPKNV